MFIAATGMVCPAGLDAPAACAAMRAGIAHFADLPYHNDDGEPIVGAAVPGLGPAIKREARLVALLSRALAECLAGQPAEAWPRVPLLVGLAEPDRPDGGASLAANVVGEVRARFGSAFHPGLSRAFPKGHTAGFDALRVARELLQDPDIPGCIVCGVDSYINARSLLWLQQHWRLKTEGNSDGVIPGEAAAALYVRRQPPAGAGPAVKLIGLGFAFEDAGVLSEAPMLGKGLAEAASAALAEAGLGMHEVDFRLSDVTGEAYGFREHSLAVARLMRVVRREFPLWHCADSIGDTGAAAGPCQLVVAFHAFLKRYAPGGRAICWTSAPPGDRAVAVVEYQADGRASG